MHSMVVGDECGIMGLLFGVKQKLRQEIDRPQAEQLELAPCG